MDGFYEWCGEKSKKDGKKQPYYFYREDEKPMIAAVLYNFSPELETNTYTMMTRQSFGKMKPMHSREPLLLTEKTADLWLGSDSDVDQLLEDEAACTEVLEKWSKFHPVTKRMGLIAYQESDCTTPIDAKMTSPVRSHNIASFFISSPKKLPNSSSSGIGSGNNDNSCGTTGDSSSCYHSAPGAAKNNKGSISRFFGSGAANSEEMGQKRGKQEQEQEKEKEQEKEQEQEKHRIKKARLDPDALIVDLT